VIRTTPTYPQHRHADISSLLVGTPLLIFDVTLGTIGPFKNP
jgi:hypothetical protein